MTSDLAIAMMLAMAAATYAIVDELEFGELLERDVDVDDEDRVDALRERYLEEEISIEEFEDRIEIVLDEDACIVRDELELVDGIGPETSAAIASRFETIDDVQEASRAELEDVHGVGPATAAAIDERLE